MDIKVYNTLTHATERFEPIHAPDVYMYNCGPTVYDYAHIGNFRSFVFADVLRRFLELAGYRVHQVMNLTDVGHMTDDQIADGGGEDKMVKAARRIKEEKKAGKASVENPDDPYQVAEFFIQAFLEDAKSLRIKVADEYPGQTPRATQFIEQMKAMIQRLLDTGHAYVASDKAVYYSVESFPAYGRLSGNTLDRLRGGAGGRVLEEHQAFKKHPADFLLWKPDPSHIMKWPSPWGEGYPGWHIECSAMATALLGRSVIDIHTGGEDNIFPHHECEIAQSCGASGNDLFARYWMHARFLLVEGQKMSKSKGNFFTLRDVLSGKATGRAVDPAVVRFELLKGHYRSNLNFTARGLEDSAGAVQKIRDLSAKLEAKTGGKAAEVDLTHPVLAQFASALADDLNTAGALGAIFKWLGDPGEDAAVALGVLRKIDSVLAVGAIQVSPGVAEAQASATGAAASTGSSGQAHADGLCAQIDAARKAKDFAAADKLRKELVDAGYEVMTTKAGTAARKKLA